MAERSNPTTTILQELRTMNTRISALETWKIAEDSAKVAVREYQQNLDRDRVDTLKSRETKAWISVLKQVGIVLGIIIALLYAYLTSKGIH